MNGKNEDTPRTDALCRKHDASSKTSKKDLGTYYVEIVELAIALELESVSLEARCRELEKGLRPFANYACEVPHVGEPPCHNCVARALLQPANTHPSQTQEKKP